MIPIKRRCSDSSILKNCIARASLPSSMFVGLAPSESFSDSDELVSLMLLLGSTAFAARRAISRSQGKGSSCMRRRTLRGKTQRDALGDSLRKFCILTNSVKKWVKCRMRDGGGRT